MASLRVERYSFSESESDESCSMTEDNIEDGEMYFRSSTNINSDDSQSTDEGPYSEEPLADEQWLEEYNRGFWPA